MQKSTAHLAEICHFSIWSINLSVSGLATITCRFPNRKVSAQVQYSAKLMCYKKCAVSLFPDSSVLPGSHITTPLGLPQLLGGLGDAQNSDGGGQISTIPLWYRFISHRMGTLCIPPPEVPGKRKGSQHQGSWCSAAGESRVQVLSWLLLTAGQCQSCAWPRMPANTHLASAGLAPLLQFSSQQRRAVCSVLPCQGQTSP